MHRHDAPGLPAGERSRTASGRRDCPLPGGRAPGAAAGLVEGSQRSARKAEPIRGRVALVTGATGLIGSHLVSRLQDAGAEVHAVSRRPPRATGEVRWWARNLAESGIADRLLSDIRPEFVFHLAGDVRGARDLDLVRSTLHANLVATVELLEAATRAECRRIVSSGSLLEEPAEATVQPVPPSPYGASRWASTAYSRMFHSLFGTPVVVLRPSFAYGPGGSDTTKVIPYVITSLLAGRSPTLTSGTRRIDWVYAADVADAFLAAATAPRVEGMTIDLGSGMLVSVREVVERIVEIVDSGARPVFGAESTRPLEQEVEVDVEAAAELLCWRATTDLDTGLRRTVDWLARRPST